MSLALIVLLLAHHAGSQFDITQRVRVSGSVQAARWGYPHTTLTLKIGGTSWFIDGPRPQAGERSWWGHAAPKRGERLVIDGAPRRDGLPSVLLQRVTFSDGEVRP